MAAGNHRILIEQGATFSMVLTLSDADNNRLDLTDHTFRGQVRKTTSDAAIQGAFTFQKLDQVPLLTRGQVVVTMPASITTAIATNAARQAEKAITPAVYDIESEIPDGTVFRWLEGLVDVSPEVTR